MSTDPVCGMQIDEKDAKHFLAWQERVYYFCSVGCQAEFERHSEDYVKNAQTEQAGEKDVQIPVLHR
jgi:YHS domain-containing protein